MQAGAQASVDAKNMRPVWWLPESFSLELMPSPRLVYHEWDRHGTCSGLAPQAYFDNVRKARASVKIPEV